LLERSGFHETVSLSEQNKQRGEQVYLLQEAMSLKLIKSSTFGFVVVIKFIKGKLLRK